MYEMRKMITPTKAGRLLVFAILIGLCVSYPHLPGGGTEKRWIFVSLVALALPTLFELTRNWSWDRAIGEWSYPIYLGHLLVIEILPSNTWRGLYCLAISIAFGALWSKYVDGHVDSWRYRASAALQRRLQRG
jgi:peptidoglycan/LPS O-acetylase OafA/YrhL